MPQQFEEGQRALPRKPKQPAPAAKATPERHARKIDGKRLVIDNAILNPKFKAFLLGFAFFLGALQPLRAQDVPTYFTQEEMPDLSLCMPAPPDTLDPAFAQDVLRFYWGKEQRKDPVRAAIAVSDAQWQLDTLIRLFSEPFGHALSPEKTPEIYKLLESGVATIELVRLKPKAYFHRKRPFERLGETLLDERERPGLTGEGSYPSGHTVRGWSIALIMAEINPAATQALYARACMYGESRVIAGAHWQSDVDVSVSVAAIGYARLQCSEEYRKQVARAKAEFKRLR